MSRVSSVWSLSFELAALSCTVEIGAGAIGGGCSRAAVTAGVVTGIGAGGGGATGAFDAGTGGEAVATTVGGDGGARCRR